MSVGPASGTGIADDSVPARAFGPGLPAEGVPLRCRVSAAGLVASGHVALSAVPEWGALRWRYGGFNDAQLFVEWETPEGPCTLAFADEHAKSAVLAFLHGSRRASASTSRVTRHVSAWTLFLLVGVPVLLLGAFLAQSGRIVDWAVARIPVETEIELGRQAFAQQKQSLSLIESHPALPMLRELGARLTRGSVYPYEFHIARDPSVNAFAMPGGFVVFNSGLLAYADSAEEVAGVLAHEIQHVERRHGLRGLIHAAGWRLTLSLLLGDNVGSMAAAWAASLGELRFSRAQESEADLLGAQRLMDAGIDPRGMVTFFRKLASRESGVPTFLSSHPASEERFRRIEQALPVDRVFAPLPYDYPKIRMGSVLYFIAPLSASLREKAIGTESLGASDYKV